LQGLVALSYRGYGGSSGRPTEKGLVEDARAACLAALLVATLATQLSAKGKENHEAEEFITLAGGAVAAWPLTASEKLSASRDNAAFSRDVVGCPLA
jgi:hypothetical protein